MRTMTVARLVRQFRSEAHLSQEDLAERAGLSPRTVSNIERGAAPSPRGTTLGLLAEALGLDADKKQWLFEVSRTCRRTPAPDAGVGEWIGRFGPLVYVRGGDRLFSKGEPGDTMYYVVSGAIRVMESAIELGPGSFVGEIAIFSPEARRTQTATAISEARLVEISREELPDLQRRHPEFSSHLLRLVTSRLLANAVAVPARVDPPAQMAISAA